MGISTVLSGEISSTETSGCRYPSLLVILHERVLGEGWSARVQNAAEGSKKQWPCNNCAGSRAHLCRYDHTVKRVTSTAHRSTRSTGELSPPNHTILITMAVEFSEQTDSEILESLGYVAGNTSPLAREVWGVSPSDSPSSGVGKIPNDPRRSQVSVLEVFPDRHVVDFLIQYFLQEVNWIYEMIYPPTFMERYTSWWLQPAYQESDDIQFGILILRLCACSIQLLPHPNYPHEGTFQCSLRELETRCKSSANILDTFRPRNMSLTRIQHMFYHAAFLANESNLRENWIILSDIVKEAHMLELHLENPKVKVTEFEMEMRKRIFGTIHMWDKLMLGLQGHWPLIPESYCDIGLPRDVLPASPSVPGAPTPFTDRIIHMRLAKALSFTNKSEEEQSRSPNLASIPAIVEMIETEIISSLPPVYSLSDYDEQFDTILPSIPLKREQLRVTITGSLAMTHRTFTGMLHDPNFTDLSSTKEQKAAFKLQKKLIEYSIDTLRSVIRLADMLPGGCKKIFLISLVPLETSVVLGLCLRVIRRNRRAYVSLSRQGLAAYTENSELENSVNTAFLEGLTFLGDLAQYSPIAAKGLQIVKSLHQKLQKDSTIDVAEHGLYPQASTRLQQEQQQSTQQAATWEQVSDAEIMTGSAIASEQVGNMLTGAPISTSSEMGMELYGWSQITTPPHPPPDLHQYAQATSAPNLWYYDDTLVERYATSTL
ncbi:hypothetical protein PAAG_04578 [Paracoccidioides lutzii Pb01]|uniref:Xylanolytic transcriptional activator regulatory domain-containing protein n=1 Tax=Paracoccidioides lutzii (strain ATCC MYA-826 / Pb01) TaxID=502779 RepID=C1H1D4_PARBA|nr:hypothetical protein PAAG_04578 [Paracoccidioides lutzii Pb01]EEH33528.2 hypothetical protein PAAG_04578 [Paracoccidioides lutzii Pb01]